MGTFARKEGTRARPATAVDIAMHLRGYEGSHKALPKKHPEQLPLHTPSAKRGRARSERLQNTSISKDREINLHGTTLKLATTTTAAAATSPPSAPAATSTATQTVCCTAE